MAFPVVQGRATGRTTASNTTSHAITLPAGIVAGELLVVVFSVDGNPTCTASGWTKLGQASNGTTVTGAVFWKIAAGSDTCTVATTSSEQSSHASFRISGAQLLEGTSANGSSTNSNPPALAPLGGSQEYLWIATRSGDSTVVATVAPSGFGNLQTLAAAGTGGASTNTADLTELIASKDPLVFTSATEQWVSWTLAAYTWSVQQDFTADDITVYTYAENDLAAGFAVDGATISANPWFSRLTDGYETWEPYGAAALVVEQDFFAAYSAVAYIEATFTAAYNAGGAVEGYDDSWFPILTGGANTWAGETVAETTGVIDGVAEFAIGAPYADLAVAYNAGSSVEASRSAIYQVVAYIWQDFTSDYTANGVVSQDFTATFTVAEAPVASFTADYEVLGIAGSVAQFYSATYRVLASAAQSFTATYQVNPTTQVETNFSAVYQVINTVEQDFAAVYSTQVEPVTQDYAADFAVLGYVQDDLYAIYQAIGAPYADLEADYNVGVIELSDYVVDVYAYREGEVNR